MDREPAPRDGARLRRAEVLGVLSLATDVGIGQPAGYGLRTAVLARRLAADLGLGDTDVRASFDLALLRWIGCTAHAHELSSWFGDELAARSRLVGQDLLAVVRPLWEMLQHGVEPEVLARAGLDGPDAAGAALGEMLVGGAGAAGALAERLGVGADVRDALALAFERWDGRGPRGCPGEQVPVPLRIVQLVQDAEVFRGSAGPDAAASVLAQRSGAGYDPALVDHLAARTDALTGGLEENPAWDLAMREEPGPWPVYTGAEVDRALAAVADFVDVKSPYTVGHSRTVARLAEGAARACGAEEDTVALVRRAGFLHDLGSVGTPNAIWEKPGPLSDGEWERARLHPYLTERMLRRSAFLRPAGRLAGLHHERLDGSGYPRSVGGALLPLEAQLLAVADVYAALAEPRAHRPALGAAEADAVLTAQARGGALSAVAVDAVLAEAGRPRLPRAAANPALLSGREVGVLRLLAAGSSNREIAATLSISEKTVGRHVENIYRKAGVHSRAAATMYALRQDLLDRW